MSIIILILAAYFVTGFLLSYIFNYLYSAGRILCNNVEVDTITLMLSVLWPVVIFIMIYLITVHYCISMPYKYLVNHARSAGTNSKAKSGKKQ